MLLDEVLAALPPRLREVFENPRVTELMINSPDSVWFELDGCLFPVNTEGLTPHDIQTTAMRIARPLGLDADKRAPIVDARLPDGSRVAIACPPIAETYALSIRRFGGRPWTADMLVEAGSLPQRSPRVLPTGPRSSPQHPHLRRYRHRQDHHVERPGFAHQRGRAHRLHRRHPRAAGSPHPTACGSKPRTAAEEEEGGSVTIRDLVRHALRHRPDRLIVGEVRGEEAGDLIQALNTGHGGSISTVHANSARAALDAPGYLRPPIGRFAALERHLRARRPCRACSSSISNAVPRWPPLRQAGPQDPWLQPGPRRLRVTRSSGLRHFSKAMWRKRRWT